MSINISKETCEYQELHKAVAMFDSVYVFGVCWTNGSNKGMIEERIHFRFCPYCGADLHGLRKRE